MCVLLICIDNYAAMAVQAISCPPIAAQSVPSTIQTRHVSSDQPVTSSPLPNSGARVLVASRDRVVDVNHETRVGSLVPTGQQHRRPRGSRAAARYSDLRARDVELRAARGRGGVDGDVLDAEEVVARRQRFGDREGERVAVHRWEADLPAAEGGAEFGDFEPGGAAVGGGGGGDFGHVEGWGWEVSLAVILSC